MHSVESVATLSLFLNPVPPTHSCFKARNMQGWGTNVDYTRLSDKPPFPLIGLIKIYKNLPVT